MYLRNGTNMVRLKPATSSDIPNNIEIVKNKFNLIIAFKINIEA
jgi:hypothetical protein